MFGCHRTSSNLTATSQYLYVDHSYPSRYEKYFSASMGNTFYRTSSNLAAISQYSVDHSYPGCTFFTTLYFNICPSFICICLMPLILFGLTDICTFVYLHLNICIFLYLNLNICVFVFVFEYLYIFLTALRQECVRD